MKKATLLDCLLFVVSAAACVCMFGCGGGEEAEGEGSYVRAAEGAISRGDFDEAITLLEKAVRLNPNETEAYLKLALIHEKIRMDTDRARRYYEKYIEVETDETLRSEAAEWLRGVEGGKVEDVQAPTDDSAHLLRIALERHKDEHEREIRKLSEDHRREVNRLKERLEAAEKKAETTGSLADADEGSQRESVDEAKHTGESSVSPSQSGDDSQEIVRLRKSIESLEAELDITRENDRSHLEKLAVTEKALKEKELECAGLSKRVSEMEKDYRKTLARVKLLEEEKSDPAKSSSGEPTGRDSSEVEAARKRISELAAALSKSKSEASALMQDLATLKAENLRLKAQVAREKRATSTASEPSSAGTVGTRTDVPGIKAIRGDTIYYTVQKGDTLRLIAEKFYGDRKKWTVIFTANRGHLTEENLIKYGDMIKVPVLK